MPDEISPDGDVETEIEVEDNSTEYNEDESTTTLVDTGDTTVIVEPPADDSATDETAGILLNHESRLTALEVIVGGLAAEQAADETTDELQSDAIDEIVDTVQEEDNVPDDEMPASKRHRWWG